MISGGAGLLQAARRMAVQTGGTDKLSRKRPPTGGLFLLSFFDEKRFRRGGPGPEEPTERGYRYRRSPAPPGDDAPSGHLRTFSQAARMGEAKVMRSEVKPSGA